MALFITQKSGKKQEFTHVLGEANSYVTGNVTMHWGKVIKIICPLSCTGKSCLFPNSKCEHEISAKNGVLMEKSMIDSIIGRPHEQIKCL